MGKGTIISLTIIGVILVFGAIVAMQGIGYSNTEITLREQHKTQGKANTVTYDKVWKVLKQKAGILDKYAGDFNKVYGNIMNQRYEGEANGAPMFKWIQERNPQFSVEMYKDLSNSVESLRTEFERVQKRLLDIEREHNVLLKTFPSSLFVGSREPLESKIVTSTKTEQVFESGKEDDVELF